MTALISVKTTVFSPEGDDEIEFVTEGEYGYGGGIIHFDYMESELTGMWGTHTCFEVAGSQVTMTREGTVNSCVLFNPGEKHYFAYSTPMGMLSMGVETQTVINNLGIHGGTLQLHYTIDVQGAVVSRNQVAIEVKQTN